MTVTVLPHGLSPIGYVARVLWHNTDMSLDTCLEKAEAFLKREPLISLPKRTAQSLEDFMSTSDVPGAKPENADALAMGCWAEPAESAEDKSLIFVESVENGRVVYSAFDLDTDMEYRDGMREADFKAYYTWDPKSKDTKKVKWTWHDKTPFPWDKVIGKGITKPGPRFASAGKLVSAAKKVADALGLKARAIARDEITARQSRVEEGPNIGASIGARIGRAIDVFLRDDNRSE